MIQKFLKGKVTGCTFFNISSETWGILQVGQRLQLKRDTENQYDVNAIQVLYNGNQIGWVGRPENKTITELLDNNELVVAEIQRVFGTPFDRPHIELLFHW